LAKDKAPLKKEAQGKPDAPPQPQPRGRKNKAPEQSHHRFAGNTGLPCAMVLTVSFALFPVIGLVVTVAQEKPV
jgi:hypothetical protein